MTLSLLEPPPEATLFPGDPRPKDGIQSRLIQAIQSANFPSALSALAEGANPNARLPCGDTLLCLSARNNDLATSALLLRHGADPNAASAARHHISLPLCIAIARNHIPLVELLLSVGASHELADNDPAWTPAHFAANHGNMAALTLLVKIGAKFDAPTDDSELSTPLHLACAGGHFECARFLMNIGARIDALDARGRSPAVRAIASNRSSTHPDSASILAELFARGLPPNASWTDAAGRSDAPGYTLAMLASYWDAPECLEIIQQFGGDIDASTAQGLNAAIFASTKGKQRAIAWHRSRHERLALLGLTEPRDFAAAPRPRL